MANDQQAGSGVEEKKFNDYSDSLQQAFAKLLKEEMEGRTGIQTKPVAEWVRVLNLANPTLLIDRVQNRWNVEPESKKVLEVMVREWLIVGIKSKGGEQHG